MRILKSSFVRSAAYAILAFALSTALIPSQASASTMLECQSLIDALRADTAVVAISGKNAEKNRTGLLDKLDGATTSLAKGKLCDAIRKLTDFRDKVNQLIASGSINSDPALGATGQDLVDGATEAIACIQAQVTESGITCPL